MARSTSSRVTLATQGTLPASWTAIESTTMIKQPESPVIRLMSQFLPGGTCSATSGLSRETSDRANRLTRSDDFFLATSHRSLAST